MLITFFHQVRTLLGERGARIAAEKQHRGHVEAAEVSWGQRGAEVTLVCRDRRRATVIR